MRISRLDILVIAGHGFGDGEAALFVKLQRQHIVRLDVERRPGTTVLFCRLQNVLEQFNPDTESSCFWWF